MYLFRFSADRFFVEIPFVHHRFGSLCVIPFVLFVQRIPVHIFELRCSLRIQRQDDIISEQLMRIVKLHPKN